MMHGMIPAKKAEALQAQSQMGNLLLTWSAANYGGIMTAKLATTSLPMPDYHPLLNYLPDLGN
ncbi:MAG: hypothetical protein R2795_17255 [Saprospiraceae bacterium]